MRSSVLRSIAFLFSSSLAGCTSGGGPVASSSTPDDPCARVQELLSARGAAPDPALEAILAESRGTPEARALMGARCEQIAAARASGAGE